MNSELLRVIADSESGEPMVSSLGVFLTLMAFVIVVLTTALIKKIYYRFRYKKRYFVIPKTSVKGIANIAMVISIAIVAIILLTVVTAGILGIVFRAYPGWRVTVEGILIKIGGLLFGPILGVFIGACTDLLSVALTAGMFHYGFFLAAMAYGLFAGLIRTLINITKGKQFTFISLSSIAILVIMVAFSLYIYFQPAPNFPIDIFAITIVFQKWQLILILIAVLTIGLAVLWICCFVYEKDRIQLYWLNIKYFFSFQIKINRYAKKIAYAFDDDDRDLLIQNQVAWMSKNGDKMKKSFELINAKKAAIANQSAKNWFYYFAPVLVTILTGEVIIELFVLPTFDVEFGGGLPYTYWFAFRTLMLVIMSFLNVAIIYPVYKIVGPTMNYNYQDDLIENLNRPLVMD